MWQKQNQLLNNYKLVEGGQYMVEVEDTTIPPSINQSH